MTLTWKSVGNDECRDQMTDIASPYWAEVGPHMYGGEEIWAWTILDTKQDNEIVVTGTCDTEEDAKECVESWASSCAAVANEYPQRTLRTIEIKRFNDQVARISYRLREMADEVERETRVTLPSTVYRGTEYGAAAHSIVHAIMWGMANLNLDSIVLLGSEVDTADAREASWE